MVRSGPRAPPPGPSEPGALSPPGRPPSPSVGRPNRSRARPRMARPEPPELRGPRAASPARGPSICATRWGVSPSSSPTSRSVRGSRPPSPYRASSTQRSRGVSTRSAVWSRRSTSASTRTSSRASSARRSASSSPRASSRSAPTGASRLAGVPSSGSNRSTSSGSSPEARASSSTPARGSARRARPSRRRAFHCRSGRWTPIRASRTARAIACRTHQAAYAENGVPSRQSKRSAARRSPSTPSWNRSARGTPDHR
ncbi:MAG: hypothetical protein KatS3mg014_0351 [Actinomycetota bacterium]|nr:MAG: hypothetical protein KatS3mg014_0351 [Actinomycetota bacterium]